MLDHFWVLVHTLTFSHFSRRQSPERAISPDLRDERAPPDGDPIVRTLLVLGERTDYVRSAACGRKHAGALRTAHERAR